MFDSWSLARGFRGISSHRSSRSSFVVLTMADRPGRAALLNANTQHFVLGFYFHWVPLGRLLTARAFTDKGEPLE
jgi:hypothetical protein